MANDLFWYGGHSDLVDGDQVLAAVASRSAATTDATSPSTAERLQAECGAAAAAGRRRRASPGTGAQLN